MYTIDSNETSLVEREIPSVMDVKSLIAEVHKRPALWDVRCGDHKARYCVPNLWKEVARIVGIDVTAEECKRKWKNLRDAYRAEVRRAERRMERDKLLGQYDPNTNYTSKWVYFAPMSFINDSKRPRYTIEYENSNDNGHENDNEHDEGIYESHFHKVYDIKEENEHHASNDGSKFVIHTLEDEDDDEAANDMLFEELQNLATPQAVRRLSETIHMTNAQDHNAQNILQHQFQENIQHTLQDDPPDARAKPSKPEDCHCSKSADDQVHFLEDLEKEEQKLIMSTRKDITRTSKLDHVGDSDYNFLVSFLPQMKKMTELENLQFRAKMCDMVLNILAPSMSTNASLNTSLNPSLNPSPVPTSSITWDCRNNTPSITYQPPESTGDDIDKETEIANNTATSTTFNDY